jgi:hypothetical protein
LSTTTKQRLSASNKKSHRPTSHSQTTTSRSVMKVRKQRAKQAIASANSSLLDNNKSPLAHDVGETAEIDLAGQAIASADSSLPNNNNNKSPPRATPRANASIKGSSLDKELPPIPTFDTKQQSSLHATPSKGKELLSNTPAEPKQSWYVKLGRALSPTKATVAKVINPAVNASTHSLATPRPLHFGTANASTATLNTPTVTGRTTRGTQPSLARPSAAELFSKQHHGSETSTASESSSLPIRTATVKGKKKESDPRKVKWDTRDPVTPRS